MRWPLAGVLIALTAGTGETLAAPPDEEACKGFKSEREALVAKGIEGDIARGPEWARANLAPDRLQEIARFIELNEQLTFRCGQLTVARPDGKPLLKKEVPAPKASKSDEGKEAEPATASGESPQGKPAAKKKKKSAAKPSDASPQGKTP